MDRVRRTSPPLAADLEIRRTVSAAGAQERSRAEIAPSADGNAAIVGSTGYFFSTVTTGANPPKIRRFRSNGMGFVSGCALAT